MKTLLLLASAIAALSVLVAVTAQTTQPSASFLGPVGSPARRPAPELPPFKSPEAMQAEFVRRFEASPGFGLSRVQRPVFRAPAPALVWNHSTYRVVPPTLIGLEDDPIVYAPMEHSHQFLEHSTNQSPRQVRSRFARRAMTAIETNAILALRQGRELVVVTNRVVVPEAESSRLLMGPELLVVGALRARHDCAACHQCKEGTLLGAFAYSLSPLSIPLDAATNSTVTSSNVVAQLLFNPHPSRPLTLARSKL